MKKIIINGDFLCRNLTGIERFAFEVCNEIDKIAKNNEFEILVPKNAKIIPSFKKIKISISKKQCISFPFWEHIIFANYIRKNNAISLDFSNVSPLFSQGIVFIHDIYAKLYAKDFKTIKEKLIKLYMCLMYNNAIKYSSLIFTVSEFSKIQITNVYKFSKDKIFIIPNGWEHFSKINPDFSIIEKFDLLSSDFYFTLGSLSQRKNLKWIADYAEKNPNELFAISGKAISGLIPQELQKLQTLKNIILLGYVSDEQVKALMLKCKAFIFPSYYEGFGIPPLEALSCGCKIIISDAASLPEIYQNSAYYINPENTNVKLNELLNGSVDSPSKILSKYTYHNAAETFYKIIKNNKK